MHSATTSFLRARLSRKLVITRYQVDIWAAIITLKRGAAILDRLLLPGVKLSRLNLVLVTHVGDGYQLEQLPAQNGDLSSRDEVSTMLFRGGD
jgi:hypothetical protein